MILRLIFVLYVSNITGICNADLMKDIDDLPVSDDHSKKAGSPDGRSQSSSQKTKKKKHPPEEKKAQNSKTQDSHHSSENHPDSAAQGGGGETPKVKKSDNHRSIEKSEKQEPIQFSGDGFTGFRREGTIELLKNVNVHQGDFSLKSNRAKVFFDTATDEVKTVIASGNISVKKIDSKTGEPIRASSDTAEFDAVSQLISLKGNAVLVRGKDTIRGELIKYNLETGWVNATKVRGVVSPQNK